MIPALTERTPATSAHPVQNPHGLVDRIAYGPVPSRRYGRTIGVNILPADQKTCRYSCVYCQLGHDRGVPLDLDRYPSADAVGSAIEGFDAGGEPIEALVVCGNGEPTLHPRLPEVVDAIVRARDRRFPKVPIVCLTAGTELGRPEVVRALRRLDECSVKLDAGRCATLHKVALPGGPACVVWLVDHIHALGEAVIQTCFFEGSLSNATDAEVSAWIEAVRRAEPRRVDVYTISRPPPSAKIRPVPIERLHEIAARLATDWIAVRVVG